MAVVLVSSHLAGPVLQELCSFSLWKSHTGNPVHLHSSEVMQNLCPLPRNLAVCVCMPVRAKFQLKVSFCT